jgi:hypothetical protein
VHLTAPRDNPVAAFSRRARRFPTPKARHQLHN